MTRESCITHRAKQAIAIVRQDYYELMERDACAAALLNIFEYWANAALAANPTDSRPWVGARPIREFEQRLLGIATDKQIRKRLALLEARGFIRIQAPTKRGAAKVYQVMIPEIQQALNNQMAGQMTKIEAGQRLDNRSLFGQVTDEPSVKQPNSLWSNDPALKKKSKEFKKEDSKKASFSASAFESDALEQTGGEETEGRSPIQVGVVRYAQPPETINLGDLLASEADLAKAQLRLIASGHKRLEMVAHGFGQWWIGPGLNDFDEFLVKACQQRKRKLEQPDGVSDAKTYINNMIRRGDWANFSLRCDEAKVLRDRAAATARETQVSICTRRSQRSLSPINSPINSLERTRTEQRHAAIGLAKFKVSRGDITRAKEIANQLGIAYADIGIAA